MLGELFLLFACLSHFGIADGTPSVFGEAEGKIELLQEDKTTTRGDDERQDTKTREGSSKQCSRFKTMANRQGFNSVQGGFLVITAFNLHQSTMAPFESAGYLKTAAGRYSMLLVRCSASVMFRAIHVRAVHGRSPCEEYCRRNSYPPQNVGQSSPQND
jgi:hypothetical protein